MPIAPKIGVFMPVSQLCVLILAGLSLPTAMYSCANHHEFMCATSLFLENTLYLTSSTTSSSYSILIFSSKKILEPYVDRCNIDTNLTLSHSLSLVLAYCPAMGLSVKCHLLQEVSLKSVG